MTEWATIPTITDGKVVRATALQNALRNNMSISLHIAARKSADQSIASTTTLTDDTHLQFTFGASELWYVQVVGARTSASTTPCWKTAVATTTTDAEYMGQVYDLADDGASFVSRYIHGVGPVSNTGSFYADSTMRGFDHRFLLYTTTPGTFKFQWAQVNSNATAVTVKKDSVMLTCKLGVNPGSPGMA